MLLPRHPRFRSILGPRHHAGGGDITHAGVASGKEVAWPGNCHCQSWETSAIRCTGHNTLDINPALNQELQTWQYPGLLLPFYFVINTQKCKLVTQKVSTHKGWLLVYCTPFLQSLKTDFNNLQRQGGDWWGKSVKLLPWYLCLPDT